MHNCKKYDSSIGNWLIFDCSNDTAVVKNWLILCSCTECFGMVLVGWGCGVGDESAGR